MSRIGYIRVSTEHQETARHCLNKFRPSIMDNYQVDRIFSEKLSGANADRPLLDSPSDERECPLEPSELAERKTNRLKRKRPEKCLCEQISGLCELFSSKMVCCPLWRTP